MPGSLTVKNLSRCYITDGIDLYWIECLAAGFALAEDTRTGANVRLTDGDLRSGDWRIVVPEKGAVG